MDGWNTSWMVGILVSFWDGLFSSAMLVSGRVYIHLHTVYLWVWIDSHNLVTHDTNTILGWVQCDEDITLHASARLELVDPIGDHSRCTREVQPIPCAPTRLLLWHKLGILILVDVTTGLEVFRAKERSKKHGNCSLQLISNHPRICVDVDVIGRVPELVYGVLGLASGTGCIQCAKKIWPVLLLRGVRGCIPKKKMQTQLESQA